METPKIVPAKRGEIIERKIPTTWYLWACPEPHCKVVLRATVEKFVVQGASNHKGKHERIKARDIDMARRRAELEKVS